MKPISSNGMSELNARIVGVGHGDPITDGAADRVHGLAAPS